MVQCFAATHQGGVGAFTSRLHEKVWRGQLFGEALAVADRIEAEKSI